MPSAMLKQSGIPAMMRKAGASCVKSSKSSFATDWNMKMPTITSAGAVAAGGIARITGVRNSASRNSTAAAAPVNPVRPPASTPEADSM